MINNLDININSEFIYRTIDFWKIFYSRDLQSSSKRFMKRNFEDVCRTDDFLELSVDDVEELISCDHIYVQSEETVVEAVSLWLEAREARVDCRARLMTHVKLSNLSPASLSSLVSRNLVTSGQQQSLEAEAVNVKSRARGLNKFIVAMAFDSNAVEYLDLDR